MKHADILRLLAEPLPPIRRQLDGPILQRFARDYHAWELRQERVVLERDARGNVCVWLHNVLADIIEDIATWRQRHEVFQQRLERTDDGAEYERAILNFTRQLGSQGRAFRADRAALRRWFGPDALADRVRTRIARRERDLVLGLELLGLHGQRLLQALPEATLDVWQRLALEPLACTLFTYEGAPAVRLASFRMLTCALEAVPVKLRGTILDAPTLQYAYRTAQEPTQDPWLQSEALRLLAEVSPPACVQIIGERLANPRPGDDLFVRRRAVLLAFDLQTSGSALDAQFSAAARDPSDYVRQTLAGGLGRLPPAIAAPLRIELACNDRAPQTRARAVLSLADSLDSTDHATLQTCLARILDSESDAFVLRTAMHTAQRIVEKLADQAHTAPGAAASWRAALAPSLSRLHSGAHDLRTRRRAAMCLERLRVIADPELRPLLATLQDSLGPEAASTSVPAALQTLPPESLGRLAGVLAQRDFGLHFHQRFGRLRVRRGHRFGRRLWRILHEWRNPSPDKRQAYPHTVGRHFAGRLHAPSAILAELSETRVPGEPLNFASEDGWRPYLPLVDQLLSLLDEGDARTPLQIATAEGLTEISAPPTLPARLAAAAALTLRFADYARWRNWHDDSQQPPDRYVRELQALGFEVHFTPWPENGKDPSVARFFAGAVLPLPLDEIGRRFENYFFSAYENTLGQLAVFTGAVLALFLGRHVVANVQLRRARAAIPMVIGGWGTRGKSGTERLKAALFNGLGYSVLSKTTGCEAMFLYGAPFQPLREMFLFRPYDKATIWEQHNVTSMAARLHVDVMLWECMALTPSFVHLLQRRWMRDDLSTITNTFPDHEDIQGPAGIDIPRVMTHFIPERSRLITSEEQMQPILEAAADSLQTQMEAVGWLESGLLTADIRARFPYEEHPDNIALVARMAAQFGIEPDVALQAMADHVVPDIGVLKVFPVAAVAGRRLSFANGMSANERFGCLTNWQRLGFDRHDPDTTPGEIISTVVNNRADRIARSHVFAGIVVEDISADYHFLIGSNLEGLVGYIREHWETYATSITLWTDTGLTPDAILDLQARRLRIPCSEERVRSRLAAMLGDAQDVAAMAHWAAPDALKAHLHARHDPLADDIVRCLAEDLAVLREYRALQERVRSIGSAPEDRKAADVELRETLGRWFMSKLVVVPDFHATGNEIVRLIAARTPPRLHNRIMGIQNIKCTGLDFVYRWIAWGQCHQAGEPLRSTEPDTFRRGLRALTDFTEFGVLTDQYLKTVVEQARHSPLAQSERLQAELKAIDNRRQQAMAALEVKAAAVSAHGPLHRFANMIEGFFDAGDAIHRRRQANRIYDDLIAQRISQARAAEELLKLTQRQKGGWLANDLAQYLNRLIALWDDVRQGIRRRVARGLLPINPVQRSPRRSPARS